MTFLWIQTVLTRDLRNFAAELDLFEREEQIWALLPGVNNPAGTLALHVAGNLQHFVGAVLGGTGYVRNRPLEFSARGVTREALKAELHRALEVVETVLPRLDDERLASEFPEPFDGGHLPTGLLLLRLVSHLSLHLGQAGYLRRLLAGTAS